MKAGEEEASYYLPIGSYLNVQNKQQVAVGDILAKMPRETVPRLRILLVSYHDR